MLRSKTRTGRLDRLVVIQQETRTNDEYNQPVYTWATFSSVWAMVEDKSGAEGYQADQLTATMNTVFTIRYLSGIDEKMRILFNNRFYNIRWIKSPDRNRTLEIGTSISDEENELGGAFVAAAFTTGFEV